MLLLATSVPVSELNLQLTKTFSLPIEIHDYVFQVGFEARLESDDLARAGLSNTLLENALHIVRGLTENLKTQNVCEAEPSLISMDILIVTYLLDFISDSNYIFFTANLNVLTENSNHIVRETSVILVAKFCDKISHRSHIF
jgi:hypothetical protein